MKHIYPFFFICLMLWLGCSQTNSGDQAAGENALAEPGQANRNMESIGELYVGFYNVENLFDHLDDANKDDAEFLPSGPYGWNEKVVNTKITNIVRVISDMNDGKGPDALGLAEVENERAMKMLFRQLQVEGRNYDFVLLEGRDRRGIDVAFMYDRNVMTVKGSEKHEISFPDPNYISRPILEIDAELTANQEPVFFFVNHWPSRRGGQAESEAKRVQAAKKLRQVLDEVYAAKDPDASIIVMGDFNDDPSNRSLLATVGTWDNVSELENNGFYNPMASMHNPDQVGTLTYKGKWNLFDQILISEDATSAQNELMYVEGSAGIFKPEYVQVPYGKGKGYPRRAIFRREFQPEGFSDHFPVYAKFELRKEAAE